MSKLRTIEVEERTAVKLEALAALAETTVADVLARIVEPEGDPFPLSPEEIAELDRQWQEIEAGAPTYPHEQVAAWLRTWGTPAFKPWGES